MSAPIRSLVRDLNLRLSVGFCTEKNALLERWQAAAYAYSQAVTELTETSGRFRGKSTGT